MQRHVIHCSPFKGKQCLLGIDNEDDDSPISLKAFFIGMMDNIAVGDTWDKFVLN